MRPLTLIVRLTIAAAGCLTPWLLLASAVVDAQPPHWAPTRWGRVVCDPRVPSRRALSRIAFPPATRRTVLRDVAALVHRNGTKALNDEDDEAIQNDPSAVGVEEGIDDVHEQQWAGRGSLSHARSPVGGAERPVAPDSIAETSRCAAVA